MICVVCEEGVLGHKAVCSYGKHVYRGGDVAQLVECRTGLLPTQVRFSVRPGIFLPGSTFSADFLTVSIHPLVQSHAFISVRKLKIL